MRPPPQVTHDSAHSLAGVVRRNLEVLKRKREEAARRRSLGDRVADAITRFCGSMTFVWLHAALTLAWFAINLGVVPGVRPFDPFPFVMLAMAASVEAIFLSTFVLISQNRMQRTADQRDELDLQIDLLAEHEITRLIAMVDAIGRKLEVAMPEEELEELEQDVAPEAVLDAMDARDRE
ncbi:MAG: DUF1003 domain-containing protein [Deltaproteobacteria bacterium]|nr:DUF1003 domain-containing protein [Deltaproteobacteria bacterium]